LEIISSFAIYVTLNDYTSVPEVGDFTSPAIGIVLETPYYCANDGIALKIDMPASIEQV